jgi:hypothetical protein
LEPDDFEALYACASDPLIWEQHPQSTRYQRAVFQGFFDGAIQSRGALAIVDRETGEMIGSSRYYDLRPDRREVTIGYTFLVRRYWGGETNRELKLLMLRHAFRYVDAVLFEIGEGNLRSRRAIEKLGARLQEKQGLDGTSHVVYRIDSAGFKTLVGRHAAY